MNELLADPLCQPNDLGKPIPRWPHATSVCLPRWVDNVEYEERNVRVYDKLACGYPRFVSHPFVKKLTSEYKARCTGKGEQCIALPSKRVAARCSQYFKVNGWDAAIHEMGVHRIHCVSFPAEAADLAADFWQHTGEGISSRQALAALEHRQPSSHDESLKIIIRNRIAHYTRCSHENVFLFPSGMSAVFTIINILQSLYPHRKSVQFGFPYVDTLKLQKKFGEGTHFFPVGDNQDLHVLNEQLSDENVTGIFCEFPMNPLMKSPNLDRLAQIAKKNQVPLIVDDTIGTFHNIQVIPPADVLVTSLTKFFSGVGDVMGGAIVINAESQQGSLILKEVQKEYEDTLWPEDAGILEKNSRDFSDRMTRINHTTEELCDYLYNHTQVAKLFYPKYITRKTYNSFKKTGAGYSGVFSIVLENPARNTAKFFDSLRISKGPSLGTNYSLACPYTVLAHYHEIDFAESCGVSKYLIRVSVGLEEPQDLISRFKNALTACEG